MESRGIAGLRRLVGGNERGSLDLGRQCVWDTMRWDESVSGGQRKRAVASASSSSTAAATKKASKTGESMGEIEIG